MTISAGDVILFITAIVCTVWLWSLHWPGMSRAEQDQAVKLYTRTITGLILIALVIGALVIIFGMGARYGGGS